MDVIRLVFGKLWPTKTDTRDESTRLVELASSLLREDWAGWVEQDDGLTHAHPVSGFKWAHERGRPHITFLHYRKLYLDGEEVPMSWDNRDALAQAWAERGSKDLRRLNMVKGRLDAQRGLG